MFLWSLGRNLLAPGPNLTSDQIRLKGLYYYINFHHVRWIELHSFYFISFIVKLH